MNEIFVSSRFRAMNRTTSTEMTIAANVRGVTSIRRPLALPTGELSQPQPTSLRGWEGAAFPSYRRHVHPSSAPTPVPPRLLRDRLLDPTRSIGRSVLAAAAVLAHWASPTDRAWSDLQSPPEIGGRDDPDEPALVEHDAAIHGRL